MSSMNNTERSQNVKKDVCAIGSNSLYRKSHRRKRTTFTHDQLQLMEAYFHNNRYPGIEQREGLAEKIQVSESRLQVWFQNRRSKWRKHQNNNLLQQNRHHSSLKQCSWPSFSGDSGLMRRPSPSTSSALGPWRTPLMEHPLVPGATACTSISLKEGSYFYPEPQIPTWYSTRNSLVPSPNDGYPVDAETRDPSSSLDFLHGNARRSMDELLAAKGLVSVCEGSVQTQNTNST